MSWYCSDWTVSSETRLYCSTPPSHPSHRPSSLAAPPSASSRSETSALWICPRSSGPLPVPLEPCAAPGPSLAPALACTGPGLPAGARPAPCHLCQLSAPAGPGSLGWHSLGLPPLGGAGYEPQNSKFHL